MPDLNLDLPALLTYVITLVIAITLHEFAHAKVADMFGDLTPRMHGRVTLNPLAHLDPIGSLLMVAAGFGWGRPVPINPFALGRRSSAAVMWVSLAGPLSNVALAIIAAIPLRLEWASDIAPQPYLPSSYDFLFMFMFINLFLALFNMIPLAPLDGDKIASYFFPPSLNQVLDTIRPFGSLILITLMFVAPMLGFNFIEKMVYPQVSNLMILLLS